MTPFLLSQLLASISFILDLSAFHFARRTTTLKLLALSTLLLAVHFWLLGHASAALLMLLATCRYLLATVSVHPRLCGLFILLALLCSVLTWDGLLSLLPLAGSLLITVAAFQTDGRRLRLFTVSGSLFWLVYNGLIHSPVAVLIEFAFLSSTLISCYRGGFFNERKNE